ncbi:secreted protein, partial [gut metagenome]
MAITMAMVSMANTMVMASVMAMAMATGNMLNKIISCSNSKIDRIT